jgi:hypothetical protein
MGDSIVAACVDALKSEGINFVAIDFDVRIIIAF